MRIVTSFCEPRISGNDTINNFPGVSIYLFIVNQRKAKLVEMSTGKRLAKRSIIGTRVCAPGEDGKYYSGVIHAVKTPASFPENNNCINLTPNTRYSVRFDPRQGNLGRTTAEFRESDLIGPGFRSVVGIELVAGQKCYVTYNGREVAGDVRKHHLDTDEVIIRICPPGVEVSETRNAPLVGSFLPHSCWKLSLSAFVVRK